MRIKANAQPGTGDKGVTNLKTNPTRKSDPYNLFYGTAERVQVACSEALLEDRFEQEEAIALTDWLQKAVFGLNAFHYHMVKGKLGALSRFCFSESTQQKLDQLVESWQPIYGGSADFQLFCQNRPLHLLNKIRTETRNLELYFFNSLEDERTLERLSREQEPFIERVTSVLNRLSSVYWLLTQRERSLQQTQPIYWSGETPELTLFLESYVDPS
ncbi:MAG: hypothetical protein ABEK59_02340 [Halobacteria archaeon]